MRRGGTSTFPEYMLVDLEHNQIAGEPIRLIEQLSQQGELSRLCDIVMPIKLSFHWSWTQRTNSGYIVWIYTAVSIYSLYVFRNLQTCIVT